MSSESPTDGTVPQTVGVSGDRLASSITDARTAIVVPVYNEVQNIGILVHELYDVLADSAEIEQFAPFLIVLVDDGSTDGSTDRIMTLAEYPGVVGVRLRRNFGQSEGLAAGFDLSKSEYIVTLDADRQNPPSEIPKLLTRLEESGADCVSGWRKERNDPVRKRIPSWVQTQLCRLTKADVHDFGCGLKAYRSEATDAIDLYGENHRYIPAMLHNHGFEVTEEVVDHASRPAGTTKYGPGRLINGAADLFFHAFWSRYARRPLHFFGRISALVGILGLCLAVFALVTNSALGVIAALVIEVLAVQIFLLGFTAEMLTKLYYQNETPYEIETVHGDEP